MTERQKVARVRFAAAVAAVIVLSGCSGARRANNESSAIGSVRMINSAQATHAAFCGGSYAPTLAALLAKGYVPADLGSTEQPVKMGYRITMSAVKGVGATDCGEPYTDYEVRAEPDGAGESGQRYFRSSADGIVFAATKADFSDAAPLQ